ncbi:hypothetical protein QTP88_025682 [Uroleucon formosanum]
MAGARDVGTRDQNQSRRRFRFISRRKIKMVTQNGEWKHTSSANSEVACVHRAPHAPPRKLLSPELRRHNYAAGILADDSGREVRRLTDATNADKSSVSRAGAYTAETTRRGGVPTRTSYTRPSYIWTIE